MYFLLNQVFHIIFTATDLILCNLQSMFLMLGLLLSVNYYESLIFLRLNCNMFVREPVSVPFILLICP